MTTEPNRIGLCFCCRHMRVVRTGRGSAFYLCQHSAVDPSYPKYPRLPVIRCAAYRAKDEPQEPSGHPRR